MAKTKTELPLEFNPGKLAAQFINSGGEAVSFEEIQKAVMRKKMLDFIENLVSPKNCARAVIVFTLVVVLIILT